MPLSLRLGRLHDALREGHPAFDLCCDHGYLGIGALLSDKVPHVTFVDKVPALIDRLSDRFPVAIDKKRATFIAADASTLTPQPISGSIVVAGVGAQVALDILSGFALPSLLPGGRLLLQPESRAKEVGDVVASAGFVVEAEEIVENGIGHSLLFCTRV